MRIRGHRVCERDAPSSAINTRAVDIRRDRFRFMLACSLLPGKHAALRRRKIATGNSSGVVTEFPDPERFRGSARTRKRARNNRPAASNEINPY